MRDLGLDVSDSGRHSALWILVLSPGDKDNRIARRVEDLLWLGDKH